MVSDGSANHGTHPDGQERPPASGEVLSTFRVGMTLQQSSLETWSQILEPHHTNILGFFKSSEVDRVEGRRNEDLRSGFLASSLALGRTMIFLRHSFCDTSQ